MLLFYLGGFSIYKAKKTISYNFLKLISQKNIMYITNNEIIYRSNISKTTFYNNFNDKLDISNFIFEEIDNKIFIEFQNICSIVKDDISEFIELFTNIIIPIIYENRDVIKLLYKSSLKGYWICFLESRYTIKFCKNTYNNFDTKIFIRIVISIIDLWITDDIPEKPAYFKKSFLFYLDRNLMDIQKEF